MQDLSREAILRMIGLHDAAHLSRQLNAIQLSLEEENGKMVSYWTEIRKTEKEITLIAGRMDDAETDIAQLQVTAGQISASVSSLQTTVSGHTEQIASLTITTNSITQSVSSLTTTVNGHTSQISTLRTDLNGNHARHAHHTDRFAASYDQQYHPGGEQHLRRGGCRERYCNHAYLTDQYLAHRP